MQTVNYLKKFPNDILLIKCTVICLWVLQLGYTVCVCEGAYALAVTDFGQIFALLYTPWGLNIAVVIGSFIDHGVQTFFVARIYKVTGMLYLSILLWLCVAFLQGVSLKLAAEAIRSDSIPLVGEKWNWLLTLLFFRRCHSGCSQRLCPLLLPEGPKSFSIQKHCRPGRPFGCLYPSNGANNKCGRLGRSNFIPSGAARLYLDHVLHGYARLFHERIIGQRQSSKYALPRKLPRNK
ncbi:hypothetical protein C8R46DRAFT_641561 [Mycena filopes]|nr:hypothetical protein C8R46DRAFT_641561 [Mycena filopes]